MKQRHANSSPGTWSLLTKAIQPLYLKHFCRSKVVWNSWEFSKRYVTVEPSQQRPCYSDQRHCCTKIQEELREDIKKLKEAIERDHAHHVEKLNRLRVRAEGYDKRIREQKRQRKLSSGESKDADSDKSVEENDEEKKKRGYAIILRRWRSSK